MAKRPRSDEPEAEESDLSEAEEQASAEDADETEGDDASSEGDDTSSETDDDSEEEEQEEEKSDDEEAASELPESSSALALSEGDEEEVLLPTQLGVQRYIFAAYFAGGMLITYVIGRAIHGIWSHYANRDFFVSAVPALAAISDESKQTYSTVTAAIITLLFLVRTYRKPHVRKWTEEVTSEMTKVKWPTKKEVTNSTIVVIVSSAIATGYLFLLDRLWAFVTNLVYGAGS